MTHTANQCSTEFTKILTQYLIHDEWYPDETDCLDYFAAMVRHCRRTNHLSQLELAEQTGVTRAFILSVENAGVPVKHIDETWLETMATQFDHRFFKAVARVRSAGCQPFIETVMEYKTFHEFLRSIQ